MHRCPSAGELALGMGSHADVLSLEPAAANMPLEPDMDSLGAGRLYRIHQDFRLLETTIGAPKSLKKQVFGGIN